jgi:hypothetical protein
MTRWQAWYTHLVTIAVGLSGVAYFFMKYAIKADDPFSVINHPWQPYALDVHVFGAPLLLFAFGLLFESHIQKQLKTGRSVNRRSGYISIVTFALMTVSGYALQVSAMAELSRAALIIHILSSGIFLVSYVMHQVVTFKIWRAKTRLANRKAIVEA